ncbi:hypothetical protein ACFO0N_18865 [Halobium salinum]|uniref:Uncharacterized protein n=1 Tax=Halobium salinum TaxID=1364940 RepID=A0ABD5PGU8_9EURY|nr:hypothetical protein [Halobium salinum]
MATETTGREGDDFVSFFRRYGRSGIHAGAAALLTLFALLYSVAGNPAFAVAGIVIYVLPPAYLYATRGSRRTGADTGDDSRSTDPARDGSATDSAPDERAAVSTDERGEPDATTAATDPADPAEGAPTTGVDDATSAHGDEHTDTGEDVDTDGDADAESDADRGGDTDTDRDADADVTSAEWTTATVPTDAALNAVAVADGAAYAVGDGGVLLAREDDRWESILGHGPGAEGETLRGVDLSDDGRAIWVAGDGGALGVYDTERRRHVDLSAPEDRTSTWNDVAVVGDAGEETVYLVNGSGAVMRGSRTDGDAEPTWDEPTKPGSGSSLSAVVADPGTGRVVACDTNGSVFLAEGDGGTFETVGIDGADALRDATVAKADVEVAAADGRVHRHADGVWTPERVAESTLAGVDRDAGTRLGVAVGDGGTVVLDEGDGSWTAVPVPTEADLFGVAAGDERIVAVGGDATVVERW